MPLEDNGEAYLNGDERSDATSAFKLPRKAIMMRSSA